MSLSSSDVSQQEKIVCSACSRKFRYKPELAGRTVKCPCGSAILVPKPQPKPAPAATAAGGEEDPFASVEWGEYDVAPEPAAPPRPAVAAQAIAPVGLAAPAGAADAPLKQPAPAIGHNLPPQRIGLKQEERKSNEELMPPSAVRDFVIPTILIAVGIALRFYEVMSPAATNKTLEFGPAVADVGMKLMLSVGLMIGGMFLAISILEVAFVGALPRTAYKLVAIAIAPGALYGILSFMGGDTYGSMIGTFATIAVYFVLFWQLMRLDMKDTGMCVFMTFVLVTAANYAAYKVQGLMSDSWV
jgi:DNA-directed RNA polymerase subunit RPC12/RpoP